jgi:predicted nucleic acid-binding protein
MIVQENTEYGISVYDHIVLNAASVKEGQVVYQ